MTWLIYSDPVSAHNFASEFTKMLHSKNRIGKGASNTRHEPNFQNGPQSWWQCFPPFSSADNCDGDETWVNRCCRSCHCGDNNACGEAPTHSLSLYIYIYIPVSPLCCADVDVEKDVYYQCRSSHGRCCYCSRPAGCCSWCWCICCGCGLWRCVVSSVWHWCTISIPTQMSWYYSTVVC